MVTEMILNNIPVGPLLNFVLQGCPYLNSDVKNKFCREQPSCSLEKIKLFARRTFLSERLCKVIPIADLGLANNRCSELKYKPETSKNLYHSPDYHFNRLTNYCINNVESEGIFRK